MIDRILLDLDSNAGWSVWTNKIRKMNFRKRTSLIRRLKLYFHRFKWKDIGFGKIDSLTFHYMKKDEKLFRSVHLSSASMGNNFDVHYTKGWIVSATLDIGNKKTIGYYNRYFEDEYDEAKRTANEFARAFDLIDFDGNPKESVDVM